jgi:hypothetical protein
MSVFRSQLIRQAFSGTSGNNTWVTPSSLADSEGRINFVGTTTFPTRVLSASASIGAILFNFPGDPFGFYKMGYGVDTEIVMGSPGIFNGVRVTGWLSYASNQYYEQIITAANAQNDWLCINIMAICE